MVQGEVLVSASGTTDEADLSEEDMLNRERIDQSRSGTICYDTTTISNMRYQVQKATASMEEEKGERYLAAAMLSERISPPEPSRTRSNLAPANFTAFAAHYNSIYNGSPKRTHYQENGSPHFISANDAATDAELLHGALNLLLLR